jgi:hypothetical protein
MQVSMGQIGEREKRANGREGSLGKGYHGSTVVSQQNLNQKRKDKGTVASYSEEYLFDGFQATFYILAD